MDIVYKEKNLIQKNKSVFIFTYLCLVDFRIFAMSRFFFFSNFTGELKRPSKFFDFSLTDYPVIIIITITANCVYDKRNTT